MEVEDNVKPLTPTNGSLDQDPEVGDGFMLPTPEVIAAMPALPSTYDENDSRVVDILNAVSTYCGKEFTEVPPDPDGTDNPDYDKDDPTSPPKDGGIAVPLAEEGQETGQEEDKPQPGDPDFTIDPDDPNKTGQIDPDVPGEPYPEGTGEDPNPDLDSLRDAYKAALAQNLAEKQSYWAVLWQVIRLISTMSCWTESYDDTFIVQWRKQTFEAKQVNGCCKACCRCDEDQIVIPIDYAPLEVHPDTGKNPWEQEFDSKPFIGGVINVVIDGKPEQTKIDAEYLNERYDSFTQKLYINREDFPDVLYANGCNSCCLCERDLTVTLYYNAGYYGIPQALLPLVCQLMGKVEDSKLPLSDCTAALSQVSGLLKSMKTGNIQYTWSDNDNKLANTQNLFAEVYNVASLAELFGLSRCNIVNKIDAGDVI